MAEKLVPLSAKIPADLKRWFKKYSADRVRSESQQIRLILEELRKNDKRKSPDPSMRTRGQNYT